MNDTSIVTHVEGARVLRQLIGGERARVDPLEHDDAGIAPQLPVELAVADVERDDPRRAAAEQDVGEAAGRGADVEREASGHLDAEDVERVRELDAAASDVRMVRLDQRDVGVGRDRRAGLGHDLAVHADSPARISPRARSRDAASPRATSAVSSREVSFIQLPATSCKLQLPAPVRCGWCTQRAMRGQMAAESSRRRAVERGQRALDALGRHPARRVEAVERRIGRLARGGVLAGGLAERLRRPLDVEDVVDDLEGEAELGGEALDRRELRRVRRRP